MKSIFQGIISLVALIAAISNVVSTSSSPIEEILNGFMRGIGSHHIDVHGCINDVEEIHEIITRCIEAFKVQSYGSGLEELGHFAHELSQAIEPCDVGRLPVYLDQFEKAISITHIQWIDNIAQIIISGSNKEIQIEKIVSDWNSKDYNSLGIDLATMVSDMKDMVICDTTDKSFVQVCPILKSILEELAIVTPDIGPCIDDVIALKHLLQESYYGFEQEQDIEIGMDYLIKFTTGLGDAVSKCHLRDLAGLLYDSSDKLKSYDNSDPFVTKKVLVGPVDISNMITSCMLNIYRKDYAGAGIDFASLIINIRSYDCDSFLCKTIDSIMENYGKVAYDLKECKTDIVSAEKYFTSFTLSMNHHLYGQGLSELRDGLSVMADGARQCHLQEIASFIDSNFGKLKEVEFVFGDKGVEVIIEGNDILQSLVGVAAAWENRDYSELADALIDMSKSLQISLCNDPSNKVCMMVQGLLEILEIHFVSLEVCKDELTVTIADIEKAFDNFSHSSVDGVRDGVRLLAKALDDFAIGVKVCDLEELSDVISAQASKLFNADIQVISNVIHVIVDGSGKYDDAYSNGKIVYSDIYNAAMDLKNQDFRSFGRDIGNLLKDSRVATCQSPVCRFLTNALGMISTLSPDFSACEDELVLLSNDLEIMGKSVESKDYRGTLRALSRAFEDGSLGLKACKLEKYSDILLHRADELGFHQLKEYFSGTIQIVINGEDIFDEIERMGQYISNHDFKNAGVDLGRALQKIMKWKYSNGCNSPVCECLEGMSKALGLLETDLTLCQEDLSSSWTYIQSSVNHFTHHSAFEGVQNSNRRGISWNSLILHVDDIDWGKVTDPDYDDSILVPPSEVVCLTSSTSSSNSSSDANGVVVIHDDEYYVSRRPNLRALDVIDDLKDLWDKIKQWFQKMVLVIFEEADRDWEKVKAMIHRSADDGLMTAALKDFAHALDDLAHAMTDCHARELSRIISKLALALGHPAAVGWFEAAFNVIMNGSQLYDDLYNAVVDYHRRNYFGMGYELAKLAILIVEDL